MITKLYFNARPGQCVPGDILVRNIGDVHDFTVYKGNIGDSPDTVAIEGDKLLTKEQAESLFPTLVEVGYVYRD